jgi:Ca2+-transporting ATPase
MVTGDQPATAANVARPVGLPVGQAFQPAVGSTVHGSSLKDPHQLSEDDRQRLRQAAIFARVNPKQKLDLVGFYQSDGAVVAMTGDGVNDAPALKKADIGIAMGQRGTQVAREAADMVLKDDAFATIVHAIEQGRVIFGNIRKFVVYLVSCNISEVLVVALASLVAAPLPLLPLQILFLNLVTDVFPAMALGGGEGDPACMSQPPRDPKEEVVGRPQWLEIGGFGMLITAAVLIAFTLAYTWLKLDDIGAVTVSFLTLALAQLWNVFNMRDRGSRFWDNEVMRNPFVWGAVALCVILILLAVYVPLLGRILHLAHPGLAGWSLVVGMSLVPWLVGQAIKSRLFMPK